MYKVRILLAIIFLCTFKAPLYAQDNITRHVYMVVCSGNPYHKNKVLQTGFRMQGTKGIITALHGVLGATSITAQNTKGDVLTDLSISQVDIDNDLALLTSQEIFGRDNEGLIPVEDISLTPGEKLSIWGHPEGIEINDKSAFVGNPVIKKLTTLIPPNSAEVFEKRRSPFESIDILYIEGNLVPGHSGAPVLDTQNRVVGVVDGGLLGGAAAISWAIPIKNIKWRTKSLAGFRLQELARQDPENLFALKDYNEPTVIEISVPKAITVADFGTITALEWEIPYAGSTNPDEKVTFKRDLKILSIDSCSLVVEETREITYKGNPSMLLPNGWKKLIMKISMSLNKINNDELKIAENLLNEETSPLYKWGIRFSATDKEIDVEATESSQFGDEVHPPAKSTLSLDTYLMMIGTRQEAEDYLTKIKQAIRQCM